MAVVAAALAWIAVLMRARGTWRSSGSPARRALWLALLFLALGYTSKAACLQSTGSGTADDQHLVWDRFEHGTERTTRKGEPSEHHDEKDDDADDRKHGAGNSLCADPGDRQWQVRSHGINRI